MVFNRHNGMVVGFYVDYFLYSFGEVRILKMTYVLRVGLYLWQRYPIFLYYGCQRYMQR